MTDPLANGAPPPATPRGRGRPRRSSPAAGTPEAIFAANLAAALRRRRFSAADLARFCNLTPDAVHKLLGGRRWPAAATAAALCRALRIPSARLFAGLEKCGEEIPLK